MHLFQRLVYPSKQFWNWFCGMAFRAAVVLLLMSSMSSKCLPFNISFIFGNRKRSLIPVNLHKHLSDFVSTLSKFNKLFNVRSLLLFKLPHSRGGTPKHTQTIIDATQKETAIDQQHSYETLIGQRHQTILRLLSSAATVSIRWRVRERNCQTTYSASLVSARFHTSLNKIKQTAQTTKLLIT